MSNRRNELVDAQDGRAMFGATPEPLPAAFLSSFRADLARYLPPEKRGSRVAALRAFLAVEGLWALAVYRLGRWALGARAQPPVRRWERALAAAVWPLFRAAEAFVALLVDIRFDVRAEIGPGFYVGHFKSIYVGPGVRIGRECNIGQMCFVGAAGRGFAPGTPVIGDRVYLGVGCKVLGPVKVGNDVAIGANAVVLESVPDRAVVVGNPARVVSDKGSVDFISIFQEYPTASPTPPVVEPPRVNAPPTEG